MADLVLPIENGQVRLTFEEADPQIDANKMAYLKSALKHCSNRFDVQSHIESALRDTHEIEELSEDDVDQLDQAFTVTMKRRQP